MRMKVSSSCSQISLQIGSNFNGAFASLTFLTTNVLTAPHHSEPAVVDQNCCCYKIYRFCEVVILFTMESVYCHCYLFKGFFFFVLNVFTFDIKKFWRSW